MPRRAAPPLSVIPFSAVILLSAVLLSAVLLSAALFLAPPLPAGDPAPQCPPGGTQLRWEGFGSDFLDRHCGECHAWSSYTSAYATRLVILETVESGLMPPFEHLEPAEIARLREWIACDMPYDGAPCPPQGTYLSFDSFAAGFFERNCTRCHSKDLIEADRNGAPPGYDWDDHASAAAHAPQIRDQLLKVKMPPDGAFVPPAEVDQIVQWISCGAPEHPRGTLFRRADPNDDGEEDISDAIAILSYLFVGGQKIDCLDAVDADGSGGLEITDGVYLLRYLFLDGPPPPMPFEVCGGLPALGCERFAGCAGGG